MIRSQEKGGKLVTTYTDDRGTTQYSYTNIPNYILMLLFTMKLTRPELKLYLYLRMKKNSNSATAWPPVRTIVRDAHIENNAIRPARDHLVALGLISANTIKGVGVSISFHDEAALELANKIDLERLEKPEKKPAKKKSSAKKLTEAERIERREAKKQARIDALKEKSVLDSHDQSEKDENDTEEEVSDLDSHDHSDLDSQEQSDLDSHETISTNINTIYNYEENGEEEISKEKGNDLTTSLSSFSPPPVADQSPGDNINIKSGDLDSQDQSPVDAEDVEDVDDEEEDEEEVDEEAIRAAIAERRRQVLGARFADIPLYHKEQEEHPYLEQFMLLHNTNQEAREATMLAMAEWRSLHRPVAVQG